MNDELGESDMFNNNDINNINQNAYENDLARSGF